MLTNFIRLLSIWRDTAFQFFPSHQIPFKGNGTYMLELNRKAISHHALLPVRTLDFRFYLTPFCFMLFSSIWSISLLYVASLYHSNKNYFFILAFFFFCLSLWLFFRFFPGWFVFEFVLFLLIIHFVYFSGILFFFFSIILWLLFDGFHFPFNGFHVSAIPIVVFRYFFFFFFDFDSIFISFFILYFFIFQVLKFTFSFLFLSYSSSFLHFLFFSSSL